MTQKPVTESWKLRCLEIAAQCWCEPTTSNIQMDARFAEQFAKVLASETSKPWLGMATTRELIEELSARMITSIDGSYYPADQHMENL